MSFKNFLQAHYEKIILAVLLICFAVLLYFQVLVVQKVQNQRIIDITDEKEPDSDYAKIDASKPDYKTEIIFSDSLTIGFTAPVEKSTVAEMMVPYPMVECVSCHSLIPAENIPAIGASKSGKCPVCGAELKPKEEAEGTDLVNNDENSNGIPDDWEKKYKIYSNVGVDSSSDDDKDGFTLSDEYHADTDPTDPLSHPTYVSRLYTYAVKTQAISGLKLKSVDNYGTDKTKWGASFSYTTKDKRSRSGTFRINSGTFDNNGISYSVVDIVEDTASSDLIVYIQAVGSTDKIECRRNQTVVDPNLRVTLTDTVFKKRLTYSVGRTITFGTNTTGKESYKIASADPATKTVVLEDVKDSTKTYKIGPQPDDTASSK